MKKIKKVLLLLVLIFGIALASCGDKKVDGSLTINYGLGMETKKVTASEYNKDLLTVEKEGYKFLGWYLDTSYSKVYVSEDKISGDVSIYAKWETIKYDITYHLDGGTNNSSNPSKYTVEDKVTLLDPTKEECTFKGWYTEESLTNKVTEIAKNTTGNKDFYAKWEEASLAVEYDITYDLNGGTNASTNPSKYTSEDEVILASPSKDGFTFAGWMLETGAPITKIEKGTTGPIVLIATWTQDVLISFVVDNETVKMVNITNGEQVTLPSNPSKTGYDFDGWYVGENEFNAQQTFTESVTVTAKFTVQKFDVKFYSGTTLVDTIKVEYNSPTNALPQEPSKTGYEFKGWYLADGTEFNAKTTLVTTSLDVTAKFEVVQYNIIYNLNGGTNNAANPLTYTIKDTIELKDPTKDNCTFAGWVGKAGEPISTTIRGSVGDIYLTAKWTNDILVTFVVDNETVKTVNITKNEQLTLPTEPKKEGYDFNGWYVGENEFNAQQTITESVTVTAKFTIKEFDVKFYVDNEVWDTIKVEYNNPTDSLPEEPSKENYSFKGWFLADGTEFNPKTTIITDDLNVYAKFEDPSVSKLKVIECVGANEAIYLKMNVVEDFEINDYKVYYSLNGNYVQIDSQLVRKVSDEIVRADIVGLKEGTYNVKVDLGEETVLKNNIVVSALDRSGYAHFNYEDGVGAYNDDGTLKDNAVVVYVNEVNKNTVTAKIGSSTKTGLANILKAATNASIPVNVRILGTVGAATWKPLAVSSYSQATTTTIQGANGQYLALQNYDESQIISGGFNELDESKYTKLNGLTNKIKYDSDKKEFDSYYNMLDISGVRNVTVEGIGDDATIFQWGFTWKAKDKDNPLLSVEVRNLKFDDYTEDACSFEGLDDSTTLSGFKSGRIWLHHNTFEKGVNYWDVCHEQDKHDGDGSTDFKKLAYATISYNHYIGNHKTGLVGGSDTQHTACLTFHHNFYDECRSRLPFARQANMHMYNNYYYKSTGNNMQIYAGAYAFIENCYFDNVKKTFEIKTSDGKVAAIKSYNNSFNSCENTAGATVVDSRTATVTNGNLYGQTFDTDSTLFYYDSVNHKSDVSILNDTTDVPSFVALHAGSGSGYYASLGLNSIPIVKHTVTFKYTINQTLNTYGTVAVVEGASVNEPEFNVEGYALVGWYSDPELTKSYNFDAEITEDTTIYAKVRKLESYTIDFVYKIGNAEEVTISRIQVYEGKKITRPKNPALTGYVFDDWYTDLEYETKFNFDTVVVNGYTIYAKFNAATTTTIVFDSVEKGSKSSDFTVDGVTVHATSDKGVTISDGKNTCGDVEVSKKLDLGGAGNSTYRSIEFKMSAAGNVTVYYSGSSGRKLALDNGTTKLDSDATTGSLQYYTFENVSVGTYYIYSQNSGISVYLIQIAYTQAPGETPSDSNSLDLCFYYVERNSKNNTSYNNQQYETHHVKTLYLAGEEFDKTYLTAYVDGEYISSDELYCEGFMGEMGKNTITVTYGNLSATYDVYVLPSDFKISNDDNGYYVEVNKEYQVGEKLGGATGFNTINQALDAFELTKVTPTASKRAYIEIEKGYYNEKVDISIPYLTIRGDGQTNATYPSDENYSKESYDNATIIEWNSLYGTVAEGGAMTHVTDSTQTVYIKESAINCKIASLTISNANNCYSYFTDVVKSHAEHRALALLVQGDQVIIDSCNLLGYQDTVEFFTGRQVVNCCYISGTTDYIFGTNNTTFIMNSTIHTIYNGKTNQGGWVNAFKGQNASANDAITYGCIYTYCAFEADKAVTDYTVSLGRPWTESSNVMIMNSSISKAYSKAATESASVGRYCNWNNNADGAKAVNAKFYEYNNTGDGAINASVTGCTVFTNSNDVANYENIKVFFGRENGGVSFGNVWDGEAELVNMVYYYFDGTEATTSKEYTYTGDIQNSVGSFEIFTIDASNGGKLTARGTDTQFNNGTKITFTATKDLTLTIISYPNYHYYTISDGTTTHTADADSYSVEVLEGATVTITSTGSAYLYKIIIS